MKPPLIDLQIAVSNKELPTSEQISQWVSAALSAAHQPQDQEVCIRIVDAEEISELNQAYRHKSGPTNVLSFPFETPPGLEDFDGPPLLGDIIICDQVLAKEAGQQQKPLFNHWAHILVHGTLHLLGYDHLEEQEAQAMESLEIQILASFGITDPYQPIE